MKTLLLFLSLLGQPAFQEAILVLTGASCIEELAEEFRIQFNDQYTKDEIKACLKSKLKSDKPQLQQIIVDLIQSVLHSMQFIDKC